MKPTRLKCDIIIFKRCRAKAWRVVFEAKTSSWQQYSTSLTSNSNLSHVWKVIKSFSGNRSPHHIPTLVANGISGKNNQHKANILANQFALSSSFSNDTALFVNSILPAKKQYLQHTLSHILLKDTRLNQAFSYKELISAIKESKNTAPGLDTICYEMFKHMSVKSLEIMLRLFNKIWFKGKIPPAWLHSIIVPIPTANKPSQMHSSYESY